MKPTITIARKTCEAIGARQVVVVAFDGMRRYSVTSYGETKAECAAVRPTCDAIADGIASGLLPAPGEYTRRSKDRRCRVCGCTNDHACMTPAGPCSWVEADLCSACETK